MEKDISEPGVVNAKAVITWATPALSDVVGESSRSGEEDTIIYSARHRHRHHH